MNILLTDALQRKTLSVLRSLGEKKHRIFVAERTRLNACTFSKFCYKSLLSPDPAKNKKEYLSWMINTIDKLNIDMIIPMDDYSMEIVVDNYNTFNDRVILLVPNKEVYETATDKGRAVKLALNAGAVCPKTFFLESLESIDKIIKDADESLTFPLVIKPRKSSGSRGIRIVEDISSLKNGYKEIEKNYENPIIQEFINQGPRYDVGLLYDDNHNLTASFVQKELRHFPEPMGPSTVQMSVKNEKLVEIASKIMEQISWKGIVELEFMENPKNGEFYFMEINTRFWASLQCAIFSGVDFPSLYVDAACKEATVCFSYKENIITRWMFPSDILRLILYRNKVKWNPSFFDGKKQKVYDDIYDKSDIMPIFGLFLSIIRFSLDFKMWKSIFWRSK